MIRKNRHVRVPVQPFELRVGPRDVCATRFLVQVMVQGRVALQFVYRVKQDLTPYGIGRWAVIRHLRAFSRIFGYRELRLESAKQCKELFFERERETLQDMAILAHVQAAAHAKLFERIPNELAAKHALLILPFLKDPELSRRLTSFQLCDEVAASAIFHWTTRPKSRKKVMVPKNIME